MADGVFERILAAHARTPRAVTIFPRVDRKEETDPRSVSARFEAEDGGAWVLTLCGDIVERGKGGLDMVLAVSDGGTPPGFVEDLCAFSFENCLELEKSSEVDTALYRFLDKAVRLYMKMNGYASSDVEKKGATAAGALDSGSGSGAASAGSASGSAPGSSSGGASSSNPSAVPTSSSHTESVASAAVPSPVSGEAASEKDGGPGRFAPVKERAREHMRLGARALQNVTVEYKKPDFTPSPVATATLQKQLSLLADMDTMALGFSVEPKDENLYIWEAKFFYTDMTTRLARDLAAHPSRNHVEMEFRFPTGYPFEPPFCRVVAPAFKRGTGFVQMHGGLCMELLTGSGWTPANSMDAVCVQLHSFLTTGEGALDLSHPEREKDYTHPGAVDDMGSVVRSHKWDVANAGLRRKRARDNDTF